MAGQWGGRRKGAGRRRNSGTAATTTPAEPRQVASPYDFASLARVVQQSIEQATRNSHKQRTSENSPFRIYEHPAAAMPKDKRLRMASDSALVASCNDLTDAWIAGAVIGGQFSEGLSFMGYTYLSELAQRPEYRIFAETIAGDATRRWIDFEVVGDIAEKKERERKDPEGEAARDADPDERKKKNDASGKIDKIKKINDELDRLEVRDRLFAYSRDDGLFGRSHLFLKFEMDGDVEPGNSAELQSPIGDGRNALSRAKIGTKNPLRELRVIEPVWTYPMAYNAINPLRSDWYNPQVWYVMGTQIHGSRLIPLITRPVPDMLKPAYSFGGLSLSQLAKPYVDIWLKTRESVGEIIHAFSVMVLATDLGALLQPTGPGGDVMTRVAMFNNLRDNQGTFVINKNTEDFKNVSAPISGLHELQAQSQEHMATVSRLPLIKLTGISPSGLNASSEGEIRIYYDTIADYQGHSLRSPTEKVINFVQLSLFDEVDPEISWHFQPLYEMTEKERADLQKAEADRDQVFVDIGALSNEEVRKRVIDDPLLPYADLDPDDVPDLMQEEEGGLVPEGAGKGLEAVLNGGGEKKPGDEKERGGADDAVIPFVAGDDAQWNEGDHPRGQPGNAGQFGPGGGNASGGGEERPAEPEPSAYRTKKDHAFALLKRGVTNAEMLKALNWPTISMPAMAKSLNMRLEKVKEGKVTKYIGHPMGPRSQPEKTHSLLPFLASRGGLRNDDANISDIHTAIGRKNKFIPGYGQLLRQRKQVSTAARQGGSYGAMGLDTAREAAIEAGYLPEDTTLAEFIDAVDGELRGTRLYPAGYIPENRPQNQEQLDHEQEQFAEVVESMVREAGAELTEREMARARELWLREGLDDPVGILERISLEADDSELEAGAPEREAIPGWDDASLEF